MPLRDYPDWTGWAYPCHGVFEITDTATRFIPLDENRKLFAFGLIGMAIGFAWAKLSRSCR